jgi:hypothetical protein
LTNTSNGNSSAMAKDILDMVTNTPNTDIEDKNSNQSYDQLDSLVIKLMTDSKSSPGIFNSVKAMDDFSYSNLEYIKKNGSIVNVKRQGEKINPESIVRRYFIHFEKRETVWVIIFSKDGKIMIANHQ